MTFSQPITILIAFGHPLLSDALKVSFEKTTSFVVKACVRNVVDLVQVIQRDKIDVVIIDYNLPITNYETIVRILQTIPTSTKVIVLNDEKNRTDSFSNFRCTSNSYLSVCSSLEELVTAIQSLFYQGKACSPIQTSSNVPYSFINKSARLSKRQLEIVKLVCQEKCNTEIASLLSISLRTVENHRYQISQKIGAKSGIGFLVYSLINGHIQLSD